MKDSSKGEAQSTSSAGAKLMAAAGKEFFWGCELTKAQPTVTWTFEEEDNDLDFLQHTLFLKHAILGKSVKSGERHIVQVETTDFAGENIVQPLLSITAGKNDMCQLNINFGHEVPVTFKLIEGNGPLYLAAQHVVEFPNEAEEEEFTNVTDIETEDDVESERAKKRKANGATKGSKKKRGKFDDVEGSSEGDEEKEEKDSAGEENEEEDDAEEENNSPNDDESMETTDDDDDDDDDDDYVAGKNKKKAGEKKKPVKAVKDTTKRVPKQKKPVRRRSGK